MRYLILLLAFPAIAADAPVQMVPLADAQAFFQEMDQRYTAEILQREQIIKELQRKLS
jgi:hypothetical protein